MLTGRGGGFLLAVALLWSYGLIVGITALGVIGTVLLLWFALSWALFLGRVQLARRALRLERALFDQHGQARHLWARSPYRVRVRIHHQGWTALPYVVALDRLPLLAGAVEGDPAGAGTLTRGKSLEIEYRFVPEAAGELRFEGVRLLVSDLEGFFAYPLFLRQIETYRCLPPLADARGHIPSVKRLNILPLLGQHPHRRPGSGIELLELRDYLPGDPPKRIAWKISARRDRLMTRELESEVPVRCTLFLDASDAVRVGRVGRNALANLTDLAGAVVQANSAARDLTGLVIFDEQGVMRLIRPERGRRALLETIHVLSENAALLPRGQSVSLQDVLPIAYGAAQDLYPELLQRDVNGFPWWLPFWSPRPAYAVPTPGPPPRTRFRRFSAWIERRLRDTPLAWLWTLPSRFSPRAHRLYRQRKQMSLLLASLYGLGPGATAHLLEDDDLLRDALNRFLGDHQIPPPLRFYDDEGRYAFASRPKVAKLARALLNAVRRGRDNELFVLLADLLENDDLGPLLKAVRIARARHHQVILVAPWPQGVPLPRKGGESAAELTRLLRNEDLNLETIVQRATTWRLHQAYEAMKQTFTRAGVSVLCARQSDAAGLILERMHRLRLAVRGSS